MSGERQKQNIVYNQGLNHESASISTEGKGDQGTRTLQKDFMEQMELGLTLRLVTVRATKGKKDMPGKIKGE